MAETITMRDVLRNAQAAEVAMHERRAAARVRKFIEAPGGDRRDAVKAAVKLHDDKARAIRQSIPADEQYAFDARIDAHYRRTG